jgi:hypothetical protein
MSFKEQERLLSDIKNLRRARREFFSTKIYLLCCAYIFLSVVFCFYLFDSFHKDGIEIPSIIFIIISLSLLIFIPFLISICSLEILKVSAEKLMSHDTISMLSSESLNKLKSFISSKLLKNKALFIRKNELDSFILYMENKLSEMREKTDNEVFKNKVNSILNGNRLNGGNNEI